jgi:hypothetical protein
MKFDAAKFIQTNERLGAELKATRMADGSARISRRYDLKANKAHIEALWEREIEPYPERREAVAKALLGRDQNR